MMLPDRDDIDDMIEAREPGVPSFITTSRSFRQGRCSRTAAIR